MANENDTFIREVNEQIRSEQLSRFWGRYGIVVVGAAILVVVGAAGAGIYEYWNTSRASNSGDQFLAALTLASENKTDEALKAFALAMVEKAAETRPIGSGKAVKIV